MSQPLSPVAQAMLEAANWELDDTFCLPAAIAAALRVVAIAGERGPECWQGSRPDDFDKGWTEAMNYIIHKADELEGK